MLKNLVIFMVLSLVSSLYAKEPFLAILKTVVSNDTQTFTLQKATFTCRPYGVVTLEELFERAKSDSECHDAIAKYYKKNVEQNYFSQMLLHPMQRYHIEMRESRCILYASGQMTLAELLLKNGLAILKPFFKDDAFRFIYRRAQQIAKEEKRGMYKDAIVSKCITELYKEKETE